MRVFDGKKLADSIAKGLAREVLEMAVKPVLAIVAVDPDEPARKYIEAKRKRAAEIGIDDKIYLLEQATEDQVEELLVSLKLDPKVHAVMLQLPLPIKFNIDRLTLMIPPEKDVDGLSTANQTALAANQLCFVPATALAVMEILKSEKVPVRGKHATVVGQSSLVGQPVALLLERAGAEVSRADEYTKNLIDLTKSADIIISAVGQQHLITADMVKDGAAVIDVGISIKNGRILGDVDFAKVSQKARLITPPIGGVGPITVVKLLQNVIEAARGRLLK